MVHIAEDAAEVVETDENTALHAGDGGAPHEEEVVDDATWQASVRAGTAVGQFRPLKRIEIVDCTVDPGQQYGLCDPGFGVVMPPPVTGIIPRPVAGFRFARDLYVAAPAESTGSLQHKANSVQSTARFNTPYGPAHQSNAHVEVMNGRVMLRNEVEPCTGSPEVMPCMESDVVEDAAEIAQKRLGYRSATLPPTAGTPFSYTPSVGGASSIRKPFKRPRPAAPQ